MIIIDNPEIVGWDSAIRGMRNPMNSWDKSDSKWTSDGLPDKDILVDVDREGFEEYKIGPNDKDLMLRLAKAGPIHAKYRRTIVVYVDITAPLYWWKEFDTYKVGTVANSCSTMHKIHAKEFTLDDFSCEHLNGHILESVGYSPLFMMERTIDALNDCRNMYNWLKTLGDTQAAKLWWWQMIQLLPSSYNQKRTVMLNYEVLSNIYQHRRNHKLDEWRMFCKWIEGLPCSDIITCNAKDIEEE